MEPVAQKIKDYLESLGFVKQKTQVDITYKQKADGTVDVNEQGTVDIVIIIKGPIRYE